MTVTNFQSQRKLLFEQLNDLNYQYKQQVILFNQQITLLSNQVSQIDNQVRIIKAENLRALELAKLDFINRKLKTTLHDLDNSLFDGVLDDVIHGVIMGSLSTADSGESID